MVSPYALTRPGGVQGQVVGLSTHLRDLGHDVTVFGPADDGQAVPADVGEHVVIGRPTALRSNGSVAPVALSPIAPAPSPRAKPSLVPLTVCSSLKSWQSEYTEFWQFWLSIHPSIENEPGGSRPLVAYGTST